MKSHLITLIIALFTLTTSCGKSGTSIADDMAAAEISIANEDVVATRNLCNGVLSKAAKDGIDASQYARLSILYMQLNDRTDDPSDIEYAVSCYREAFAINADSASAFYSSLPVEQDKYVMTLASIVHTLDNPREIPFDHDSDGETEDSDD